MQRKWSSTHHAVGYIAREFGRLVIGFFGEEMANKWGIPKCVEDIVMARDRTCVYCGIQFGVERKTAWSWEHIINDVKIATVDNIALCCVGCNASKGAKVLSDWIDSPNAKRRGVSLQSLAPVVRNALSKPY